MPRPSFTAIDVKGNGFVPTDGITSSVIGQPLSNSVSAETTTLPPISQPVQTLPALNISSPAPTNTVVDDDEDAFNEQNFMKLAQNFKQIPRPGVPKPRPTIPPKNSLFGSNVVTNKPTSNSNYLFYGSVAALAALFLTHK
jgi:hypothetical protein